MTLRRHAVSLQSDDEMQELRQRLEAAEQREMGRDQGPPAHEPISRYPIDEAQWLGLGGSQRATVNLIQRTLSRRRRLLEQNDNYRRSASVAEVDPLEDMMQVHEIVASMRDKGYHDLAIRLANLFPEEFVASEQEQLDADMNDFEDEIMADAEARLDELLADFDTDEPALPEPLPAATPLDPLLDEDEDLMDEEEPYEDEDLEDDDEIFEEEPESPVAPEEVLAPELMAEIDALLADDSDFDIDELDAGVDDELDELLADFETESEAQDLDELLADLDNPNEEVAEDLDDFTDLDELLADLDVEEVETSAEPNFDEDAELEALLAELEEPGEEVAESDKDDDDFEQLLADIDAGKFDDFAEVDAEPDNDLFTELEAEFDDMLLQVGEDSKDKQASASDFFDLD